MEMNNDIFTPDLPIPEPVDSEDLPIPAPAKDETPAETPPPRRRRKADAPVLTIESGDEIETEDAREAAAWHEIHNAYRTRRILSAPLGGIEQTDSGKTSGRGAWCRPASLPLPTSPYASRFSAWSAPSWRETWHGIGSVMPMTALL